MVMLFLLAIGWVSGSNCPLFMKKWNALFDTAKYKQVWSYLSCTSKACTTNSQGIFCSRHHMISTLQPCSLPEVIKSDAEILRLSKQNLLHIQILWLASDSWLQTRHVTTTGLKFCEQEQSCNYFSLLCPFHLSRQREALTTLGAGRVF